MIDFLDVMNYIVINNKFIYHNLVGKGVDFFKLSAGISLAFLGRSKRLWKVSLFFIVK